MRTPTPLQVGDLRYSRQNLTRARVLSEDSIGPKSVRNLSIASKSAVGRDGRGIRPQDGYDEVSDKPVRLLPNGCAPCVPTHPASPQLIQE